MESNDQSGINKVGSSVRTVEGIVATAGTADKIAEAKATPELASLRSHIKEGLNANAQGTKNMNDAQKQAFDALTEKPQYRMLSLQDDGLYVTIATLIYGKYAKLSGTQEPGLLTALMCMPFASGHLANNAIKNITDAADTLERDFKPALPTDRFKIIQTISTLLRDGATDLSCLLPDPEIVAEIAKELSRKTSSMACPLKNTWSFSAYTFLTELLETKMGANNKFQQAIGMFVRGIVTFYTQLQRAVAAIDFPNSADGDYTYETSELFKAANELNAQNTGSEPAPQTTATLADTISTHRNTIRNLLAESNWLEIPFLTPSKVAEFKTQYTKELLAMQQECLRINAVDTEDVTKRTEYTKNLAALHDRISVLVNRYGSCLAEYKAAGSELRYYTSLAEKFLASSARVMASPSDTVDTEDKKKIGLELHDFRAEIKAILEMITESNAEPTRLYQKGDEAAVAIVSYYVDMHRAIWSFLHGNVVPELNKKFSDAMGYISWLKGLHELNKKFSEHAASQFLRTISNDEELGPEEDPDYGEGDPDYDPNWMFQEDTHSQGKVYTNPLEMYQEDAAFHKFYDEWADAYNNISDAFDFYMGDKDVQRDYNDLVTEETAENAHEGSTNGEVPTTSTDAPPERMSGQSSASLSAQQVLDNFKGNIDVVVKHHVNVPMYWTNNWAAYWNEYERNLKKNYGKKQARTARRQEEDIVGIMQYKKAYNALPYSMFFRSYIKPHTSYITTTPVQPKDEDYKHYYFAYGSNLDTEQIAKRTPYAKFVGRVALKNYKLTFVTYNYTWKGGVANIEPAEGDVVYGILWKFTDDMITKMDRYEGHPHKYVRHDVQVQNLSSESNGLPVELSAVVYEIQNKWDVHEFCPAGDKYYEQIKAGYEKYQFPLVLLEEAQKYSKEHKVERTSSYYTGKYYGTNSYANSFFDSDEDYQTRYPNAQSTASSTNSYAGSSYPSPRSNGSSIFSPERWFLDMTKNWWEATEV